MNITCIGALDPRVRTYIERSYKHIAHYPVFTAESIKRAVDEADHVLIVLSQMAEDSLSSLGLLEGRDARESLIDIINQFTNASKTVFLTSIIRSESSFDLLGYKPSYFLAYCVAAEFTSNKRFFFIPESYDQLELSGHEFRKMLVYSSSTRSQHIKLILETLKRSRYRSDDPVKLLVVDADNTLWGGVASEVGLSDLVLGGHNLSGDAYIYFQQVLKSLKERGFLLVVCSKSVQDCTENVLAQHPESVLRLSDFVDVRCSWTQKSTVIRDVLDSLGLRQESALFIDDSAQEIDEVSSSLPRIKTLLLSDNIYARPSQLINSIHLTGEYVTRESAKRTDLYLEARKRSDNMLSLKDEGIGFGDWLKTLKTKIRVTVSTEKQIPARLEQLLIRSRQFNVVPSIPRCDEGDESIEFALEDRFGPMGTIAGMILEVDSSSIIVKRFVISCRAFNRYVEHEICGWLCEYAIEKDVSTLKVLSSQASSQKYGDTFMKEFGLADEQLVEINQLSTMLAPYRGYIETR